MKPLMQPVPEHQPGHEHDAKPKGKRREMTSFQAFHPLRDIRGDRLTGEMPLMSVPANTLNTNTRLKPDD